MEDADYAPLHTTRERLIMAAKTFAWAIPLLLLTNYGFLPWWKHYTANAQCYHYGSFTGVDVVFYGLFAGLPLLLTITVGLYLILRAIKILKAGQDPLPGEKVLQKTRYKRGKKAKVHAIVLLLFPLIFLVIGVWGIGAAHQTLQTISAKNLPSCIAHHSG